MVEPEAADPGPTVADLGEFGVIEAVTARAPQGASVLLGPGDDAAVVAAPDARVVVSTDVLVEGRHFDRAWSSGYDVGRKAAAANLADIAAMGATPTAIVVGLATPPWLPAAWVLELAAGLRDECEGPGASVAGGDLVGAEQVVIAVTALGDLQGRRPLTRSGARRGDVVAVCGRLGAAAAGLALLSAGREAPAGLVRAHRRPNPPYAAGPQAAERGASALIDVSDGLLAELGHLARAAGVGIEVRTDALAPDRELDVAAEALGGDRLRWVLTGGEDHALVGCFPPGCDPPPGWQVIAQVSAEPGVRVDGRVYDAAPGWEHFP